MRTRQLSIVHWKKESPEDSLPTVRRRGAEHSSSREEGVGRTSLAAAQGAAAQVAEEGPYSLYVTKRRHVRSK